MSLDLVDVPDEPATGSGADEGQWLFAESTLQLPGQPAWRLAGGGNVSHMNPGLDEAPPGGIKGIRVEPNREFLNAGIWRLREGPCVAEYHADYDALVARAREEPGRTDYSIHLIAERRVDTLIGWMTARRIDDGVSNDDPLEVWGKLTLHWKGAAPGARTGDHALATESFTCSTPMTEHNRTMHIERIGC